VETRRQLHPGERVAALLVAAIVFALNVAATATLFLPQSTFGYALTYTHGHLVESVDPATSAAQAGIVPGDQIDFTRSSLHDRILGLNYQPALPGERITIGVVHDDRARTTTLEARPPMAAESQQAGFSLLPSFLRLSGFVYIAVALIILLQRPSRMTWGLFLYLMSATSITTYRLPDSLFLFAEFTSDVLSIAGPVGLIIFAARFPSGLPSTRWKAWLDRSAIPIGALFAIPNLAWDVSALLRGSSPALWMSLGSTLAALALVLVAAIALGQTYLTTAVQERQRLQWVIAGVLMTLISYAADWARYWEAVYPLVTWGPLIWISALLYAVGPFTLAYAVVRQRVFDISFVISRTVVYGVLTASIFAIFAFIEWLLGQLIEHSGATVFLLALAAIGVAFWLQNLHASVETWIESVFFRRRHAAETRLACIAEGLPYAEHTDDVDEALVREPRIALALTSATLFKRDLDGRYVRDGEVLDGPLLLQVQGKHGPLRLHTFVDDSDGATQDDQTPVLAVPVFVRSRLEAVALYGAHVNGEDIDPDEVDALKNISVAAGTAYAHLDTLRMTRELAKFRALAERQAREIAVLRERTSRADN
jgi:hypothetical protein